MDTDVMSNHYAHPRGRPRLLKAISKHYSASFENLAKEGRELANEEIVVTAGANGGTYAALCAHLQPGDEVICFEPFFDQYFATIHFNTGVPKFVPLHPPTGKGIKSCDEWTIDFDELRAAFGPKTKAIIVNTPHNPVGKVFTREELTKIAELCVEFNVLCMADEVYDCLVYDDKEHLRIAGLPGMWERTLTILSGGSESPLSQSRPKLWPLPWHSHNVPMLIKQNHSPLPDGESDGSLVHPNSQPPPLPPTPESSFARIPPCKKPSLSDSNNLLNNNSSPNNSKHTPKGEIS
jgi:hypothetical protein